MAAHATAAREPLLTRAKVIAALSGLVTALVMFGVLPVTLGDELKANVEVVAGAVATLVSVLPAMVHAVVSRKVVTPVADPRDDDGNELVPVGGSAVAMLDASASTTIDVEAALADAEKIYPTV